MSKYSQYILTDLKRDSRDATLPPGLDPATVSDTPSHKKILSLDDVVVKGSFYTESVWLWPGAQVSILRRLNPTRTRTTMTK